ncbi:IS66 family insertion sequence element accessory protein TnpA [Aliiglaciecola lipolytica]|uniref:IS66 family insertion sequence element accessory protein TnpA n=1 Tax=Aliiglaciecola lipolytica TaxID=477689 RepID=UPI001C088B93|nr:hypothetical protein [Aliiglaciecola lipolytica]MBU2877764.1 hypothetical protein [Aliiglaciecola lipolytica]
MRRERRTQEGWEAIFVEYRSSELTAHKYCVKHDIHLKTFSARKSDLYKGRTRSTNKLLKVASAKPEPVATESPITIVYRDVTLNVEQTSEVTWLAGIMKAVTS